MAIDPGTTAVLLSVVSTVIAVLLHRLVAGTGLRFLFERPRWAMLRERRKAAADAHRPLHS